MKIIELVGINGERGQLFEDEDVKVIKSAEYNSIFNKKNGFFARWGKDKNDDPQMCPFGPELLDLEISSGFCKNNCLFCYKGNGPNQQVQNMTLETFKEVVDKFPKVLSQIAFGITSLTANPDFFRMMDYCREIGIVPNFTMTGIDLSEELADEIVKRVGAVAISLHEKEPKVGYRAISMMADRDLKQTNVHLFTSRESLPFIRRIFEQYKEGHEALRKVNAFVLLGVKNKGRATEGKFHSLSIDEFKELVSFAFENDVPIGMDSCSANKFMKVIEKMDLESENKQKMLESVEPCESGLFSSYISCDAKFYSCSFCEDKEEFGAGIDVLQFDSFLDVWKHNRVNNWREKLLSYERACPAYPEINL